MVTTAELDMTRALFGSNTIRDGNRDSASTSHFVPSRFDIYLHQQQLVYIPLLTGGYLIQQKKQINKITIIFIRGKNVFKNHDKLPS